MRSSIVFCALIASLFLIPMVYGNELWIKQAYTNIQEVYEIDDIVGNELHVDMVFRFYVYPLSNLSNNTIIEFTPWFTKRHGEPIIDDINICENAGYGAGYTFDSISINCKEALQIPKIEKIDNRIYHPRYLLTIPVENLTTWKEYTVHIRYKIPDFVMDEGSNYILSFTSLCHPNDDCNINNWQRTIRLPSTKSVLVDHSENVKIVAMENGRWILRANGGGPFFIRYYDSDEKDWKAPLIWGFIGALIGVFVDRAISWGWNTYREYKKR